MELGCSAVDKGSNAPNLFVDAKSDESALPPFSSGARDDLIQRRTLDAYLRYWELGGAHNPASAVDGRAMIEAAFLWTWDARPYPAFPARTDVWSDAASWRLGHWLNGRAGLSSLNEVVLDICARAGVGDVDASALTGAVSGYIVDSPADARGALEPLMAAYDFVVGERGGELVFFHRENSDPVSIGLDDFAEETSDTFAQRGDPAETPMEARVRFIDAAKDYLIAGVGARRLDRAAGGVVSIDAPLVLEADAAETIAQAVLADRRAASERRRVAVGPAHLALEPGDRISLGEDTDTFEVQRIEDGASRALELRRTRPPLAVQLQGGDPNAPTTPSIAPTPAFAVLDLPLLPGAEDDERPLAAVFAAPWLGAHDLYAGSATTQRARVAQPAIMGELLWALWPGPLDRWDDGNAVRIKLYGGALASASGDAVLNGANVFAIENEGEWELFQARTCELVAPNEYVLSGFLRGVLGSGHAMGAPHAVGARIIKLDTRLVRADVGAHEWGEAVTFIVPPALALSTDVRAATAVLTLPHAASRPWAPAHLAAKRVTGGDVSVSWIRCARTGGDAWGPGEPPLGESTESYQLDIFDGTALKRSVICAAAAFTYTAAMQTADFGSLPTSLRLQVSQIAGSGATGLKKELTIPL